MLGHKVTSATNLGDSAEISIEPVKGGESVKMTCDHLLVSTGRKPHTDNLGLEDLGIKKDERGRI